MPESYDDYKNHEKINGIIYNMSPSGGFLHSQVNGNIYFKIRQQLQDSIYVVSIENLDLYLSEDEYVTPDIMILCDRNQVKKDTYRGIPKFIAETLSPSTALKDRTVKMDKYAELGIHEYWIISPKERSIEIYYLKNGIYVLQNSLILEDEIEGEHYNAEIILSLKEFPNINMMLSEILINV